MTTPNEELIGRLRAGAFHRSMGHWGDLHCEAADAMQSQAERIAELERESETHSKAYGLAIVERDNLRHELKTAQEGWRCECSTDDACRFARERDALRAQLDAIAATEPVAYRWVWKSKPWDIEGWCYTNTLPTLPELQEIEPLFTRPMPALNPVWCNGDEPLVGGGLIRQGRVDVQIRTALSKYKGGKA